MALQIWLPLNGDLHNQGLNKMTFSNSNGSSTIVVNDNGKIGKCYSRSSSKSAGRIISNSTINLNGDLSMFCWAKVTACVGDTANGLVSNHSHANNTGFGITVKQISTSDFRISCNTGNGSNRTYMTYYGTSNIKDKWCHLGLTYDNTKHEFKLWVNGICEKTVSYTNSSREDYIMIFDWSTTYGSNDYKPACFINDVRIYDHTLSPKEVKELSKGLVLHYKLDNLYSNGNLVTGLVGGGQTTISGNTANITGNNSDTYFYIKLSNAMTSGKTYKISCIGNFASGIYYNFPIAGQSNTSPGLFKIQNGYCEMIFVANDACQNAGTQIILDDSGRNPGVGTITNVRLEELSIIYDCSGYKHNGSLVGPLSITQDSSRYNNSSLFSATVTNYITIPYQNLNGPYNNKELTFSFWINTQQQGNRHMIFGIVGSYNINIELSTSNTLRVYWAGTPDWSPGITCTLNTWTYIGIVVSSTYIKCYKNGVLIGTNTTTPNWAGCTQNLMIGSDQRIGTYFLGAKLSDFRIYSTLLSDADIKELYDTAGSIDNQGDLLTYEFNEVTNNILFNENYGIISKRWLGGLSKYTQTNCNCTLTDDGYRIYRTPNVNNSSNGGSNSMWGGLVLDNGGNRFGLTKGHTYIIEFYIKGKSSNAASDVSWSNLVGWGGGGLTPSPSNVSLNNPVGSNFQSDEWRYFYYKFTINDDVYKVCTSSYSSFTKGNTYISYRGFKFGFGYTNTGSLGTDLYIKNLSMYDITTNTNININKRGIMSANKFIEEGNITRYFYNKTIESTQFLEI